MATITSTRRTYKDTGSTSDVYCIRIVRTDGTTLRYTSNSRDLTMTYYITQAGVLTLLASPVTYESTYGIDLSAIGFSDTAPGEFDLEGVLSTLGIGRDQIISGTFNNARVYVFLTSWENPVEDDEKLFTGFWGESTMIDGRYIVKFTSLVEALNINSGRLYTRLCDAQFGGTRCGVITAPVTWTASTTKTATPGLDARLAIIVKPTVANGLWYKCTTAGVTGATEPTWVTTLGGTTSDNTVVWTTILANVVSNTFSNHSVATGILTVNTSFLAAAVTAKHYVNGYVEFLTGDNKNQKYRIRDMTSTTLSLHTPMLKSPSVGGDTLRIVAGCNKRLSQDCATRFDNNYNFQGFPYLPGKSNLGYIAGTK